MNSHTYQEFLNSLNEIPTNLTWDDQDEGVWKGWTYSPNKNRYYFDDIGDKSLSGLWNSKFLGQADK